MLRELGVSMSGVCSSGVVTTSEKKKEAKEGTKSGNKNLNQM